MIIRAVRTWCMTSIVTSTVGPRLLKLDYYILFAFRIDVKLMDI